jgi:hypothetical protein
MSLVPTDKTTITFRVSREEIRDALKRAASDDQRSVTVILERIVVEWLEKRGYLKGDEKKSKARKGAQ